MAQLARARGGPVTDWVWPLAFLRRELRLARANPLVSREATAWRELLTVSISAARYLEAQRVLGPEPLPKGRRLRREERERRSRSRKEHRNVLCSVLVQRLRQRAGVARHGPQPEHPGPCRLAPLRDQWTTYEPEREPDPPLPIYTVGASFSHLPRCRHCRAIARWRMRTRVLCGLLEAVPDRLLF